MSLFEIFEEYQNFQLARNTVNSFEEWIYDCISELKMNSESNIYAKIAYDISSLTSAQWESLGEYLKIKSISNPSINSLLEICNVIVSIENTQFQQILSYPVEDAANILLTYITELGKAEAGIYVGIIRAQAVREVKAKLVLLNIERNLNI